MIPSANRGLIIFEFQDFAVERDFHFGPIVKTNYNEIWAYEFETYHYCID